jgi:hypothetical protein
MKIRSRYFEAMPLSACAHHQTYNPSNYELLAMSYELLSTSSQEPETSDQK